MARLPRHAARAQREQRARDQLQRPGPAGSSNGCGARARRLSPCPRRDRMEHDRPEQHEQPQPVFRGAGTDGPRCALPTPHPAADPPEFERRDPNGPQGHHAACAGPGTCGNPDTDPLPGVGWPGRPRAHGSRLAHRRQSRRLADHQLDPWRGRHPLGSVAQDPRSGRLRQLHPRVCAVQRPAHAGILHDHGGMAVLRSGGGQLCAIDRARRRVRRGGLERAVVRIELPEHQQLLLARGRPERAAIGFGRQHEQRDPGRHREADPQPLPGSPGGRRVRGRDSVAERSDPDAGSADRQALLPERQGVPPGQRGQRQPPGGPGREAHRATGSRCRAAFISTICSSRTTRRISPSTT